MKTKLVNKFSKSLIRSRWTRDAAKQCELPKSRGYYPDKTIQVARYGALMAEYAQKPDIIYLQLMKDLMKVELKNLPK